MENDKLIYLDYNSTSPIDDLVLYAMMPYFKQTFGNAGSRSHPYGWHAQVAIDKARSQVANLLDVSPNEIVFTSGATEALNLALKGVYETYHQKGKHIVTVRTEHKAVLDVCEYLEKIGAEVTYLDVDDDGLIDLAQLKNAIRNDTILVSIMWANNETGVLQPIEEIGAICRNKNVFFLSDGTQAVGKILTKPKDIGIDLLAFSGHKAYGPKGVGALFVNSSSKIKLKPLLHGGGHEKGMRSGTLNVPGIVGLGKALEMSILTMEKTSYEIRILRDFLEAQLLDIEESYLNGHADKRMPNVTNISFKYIESEVLIATFNQNIAVSTGSACTSASLEPSHVLIAQGLTESLAQSAIRFSLGKQTTLEEIKRAIYLIRKGVDFLRSQSPVWQMYKDGIDVDSLI